MHDEARRARRLLFGGAALSAAGLAVAGTAAPTFGGAVVVAGWAVLAYGIHAFGRSREGKPAPAGP